MKREGARERERDEGKIEREEEKMEWEAFRLKYQKINKWKKKKSGSASLLSSGVREFDKRSWHSFSMISWHNRCE